MSTGRAASEASRTDLIFHRYDASEARKRRDTVADVYARSYIKAIASGGPFDSVEAFMTRFDSYAAISELDLMIVYLEDGTVIGQTWGWPLDAHTGWWRGLNSCPEPGFTHEDGHRTFALSEIMVVNAWTRKGVAHALHDKLLYARTEERATLLVEPENIVARRAYLHWGWRKVAQLRPAWDDAPLFDVLVLRLGNARGGTDT